MKMKKKSISSNTQRAHIDMHKHVSLATGKLANTDKSEKCNLENHNEMHYIVHIL